LENNNTGNVTKQNCQNHWRILIIAGFGYIINSLLRFLMRTIIWKSRHTHLSGEMMIIFWLIFKGVNVAAG